MTSRKFGVKQGYPCRYVLGHQSKIRPVIEDAKPFKIDDVYCRLIPLTRGLWAIVDEIDYYWLMKAKWFAKQDKKGNCFYAVRHADGNHKTSVYMHREIAGIPKPDHSNSNTLDNRRKNVRPASCAENMQNTKKPCTNKSGYKGVSWHKVTGKWTAQICVNRKKIYLGIFSTPELAYAAYCAAALKFHGAFARVA
jgi:hypothetical protein